MTESRTRNLAAATAVLVGLLVLSGLNPYDRATWALEVFPVVIALPGETGAGVRRLAADRGEWRVEES